MGYIVGDIEILGSMCNGAYVWKGRCPKNGLVALRIIDTTDFEHSNEEIIASLKKLTQLNSPYIVNVHAVLEFKDRLCYVMEYLECGRSINNRILLERFSLEDSTQIIQQIIKGLQFCLAEGYLQTWLYQGSVMLLPDGKVKLDKVGLHGIGRSQGHIFFLPPQYIAPEECKNPKGEFSQATTIFSLGVYWFNILTGEYPFSGDSDAIMSSSRMEIEKLADDIEFVKISLDRESKLIYPYLNDKPLMMEQRDFGIPRGICSIISKMLHKNVADRYQTFEELSIAINEL